MHIRVKHGGMNDTLMAHCERYWILCGRQVVKTIVNLCVICQKVEGHPYCFHPFPACRVSDDLPFAHTGIEFAGPLYCSESKDGKNTSKASICLLMCSSTRAIRLELTRGMNLNSFFLAFGGLLDNVDFRPLLSSPLPRRYNNLSFFRSVQISNRSIYQLKVYCS